MEGALIIVAKSIISVEYTMETPAIPIKLI